MGRHPKHDYRSVCIYHLTLNKAPDAPAFSTISGSLDHPVTVFSQTGMVVYFCIRNLHRLNPAFNLFRFAIMPDHLHIVLYVRQRLDEHLGVYISRMKNIAMQIAWQRGVCNGPVFGPDYYDRFLRKDHSLDTVIKYVSDNPRRLLVRRLYPERFRRVSHLLWHEKIHWNAYGNMQLYDNPFKSAVICHRKSSEEEKKANQENWMHTAANGGVLVSPFISQDEKAIRKAAETAGGKIILVTNKPFGKIYKPEGHNFRMCENGRLLIVAPEIELPSCRHTYLLMNALAEAISSGGSKVIRQK